MIDANSSPTIRRIGLMITGSQLPGNDGDNINGPSVIKVPDWVDQPLGRYYMYFAHHNGKYIRLAYADDPTGPWSIYQPGVLPLEQCPAASGHVASPDVHVDSVTQTIFMYFHAPAREAKGQQKTFVAVSTNGLDFKPSDEILGIFYFRAWFYAGYWYALGKARLYRSTNPLSGFQPGPVVLEVPGSNLETFNEPGNIRHTAADIQDDRLFVYYTRQGGMPEHILRGEIDMSKPWTEWRISKEVSILKPELTWEGANLPLEVSTSGAAMQSRNELRDPCIFKSSLKTLLYYSVAGEQGIAVAELS